MAKQRSIVVMTIKAETGLIVSGFTWWMERKLNGLLITSPEYKQKYYVTIDTQVFINW